MGGGALALVAARLSPPRCPLRAADRPAPGVAAPGLRADMLPVPQRRLVTVTPFKPGVLAPCTEGSHERRTQRARRRDCRAPSRLLRRIQSHACLGDGRRDRGLAVGWGR